jgi:hypothetical protein
MVKLKGKVGDEVMKVPPGTKEYQDSIRKSKDYLQRLRKGSKLLDETLNSDQLVEARKIIRHWEKVGNELFVELEIVTLIHQHLLTGNQVLIKADGTFLKIEDVIDKDALEIDPWTLLCMEKLKTIFGEDFKQFVKLDVQETPPSS